jgi:hypothetical protein
MREDGSGYYIFCGIIIAIWYLIMWSFGVRESDVAKFARMEEWESYKIEGYCFLGCPQDFYATQFTAIKKGQSIKGCVCSGLLFKNSTLRLD